MDEQSSSTTWTDVEWVPEDIFGPDGTWSVNATRSDGVWLSAVVEVMLVDRGDADTGAEWALDMRDAHGEGCQRVAVNEALALDLMRHLREECSGPAAVLAAQDIASAEDVASDSAVEREAARWRAVCP